MTTRQDWTLFLDRDGVINRRLEGDYVKTWDAFEFLPGVLEALNLLKDQFAHIIIVTNQQGIGKGLMTEADLEQIHNRMKAEINKAGGRIDAVFYCPDLATKPGNCRKPSPHMALEARWQFPSISLERSVMVGDTESDMEFAANCGMQFVYIGKTDQYKKLKYKPNKYFRSLLELAKEELPLSP